MSQSIREPIRVLHVVTNMSYGGLENLLMNYYRNIDKNIIQFDFLTHVDIKQDFEMEIEELGGKIYRLPRMNPFSLKYRKQLDKFFDHHKEYKIIHSHLDCMAGVPLKIAKKKNIPIRIAHSHSSNQNRNLKYIIKLLYKKSIPQYATQLFSCGKKAGDWMFDGNKYVIMQNAIDANAFRYSIEKSKEYREKFDISEEYIIGHVGQFRVEKNHLFLIEVFAEILKIDEKCKLLLIGKGPQMEEVKIKVEELQIADKVIMLGARADIEKLMQMMDVFVLPSIYEGLPVTMIEAQASGLPCVISDRVPLECKIIDEVQQISLEANPSEWARAILAYKNYDRKDTYIEIQKARFDIKENVKWLEEFYCNNYEKE